MNEEGADLDTSAPVVQGFSPAVVAQTQSVLFSSLLAVVTRLGFGLLEQGGKVALTKRGTTG